MKHQYFADRRDFYKYELLLDLADGLSSVRRLLSVLMLTPNDETTEGSIDGYEPGRRRHDLFRFLKGCLDRGTRDVSLLRQFMDQAGLEYRPFHDDSYFDDSQRSAYFMDCAEVARECPLIFFDPDIGLETRSPAYMRQKGIEKYLLYADVSTVAKAAAPEAVVVVYQHLQRNKARIRNDLETRCRRLCQAVGSPFVTYVSDGDVAFLVTGCSEGSTAWANEIVTSHGVRHGLHVGRVAAEPWIGLHNSRKTRAGVDACPHPSGTTLGQGGLARRLDVEGGSMHVRKHVVSNRNGRQVMVAGLRLRDLGYQRGARVEVTDPSEDPANEPWQYIVSNNEHATLVSKNPAPPAWIRPGVLIQIRVQPPPDDVCQVAAPRSGRREMTAGAPGQIHREKRLPLGRRIDPSLATRSEALVSATDLADWRSALIKLLNAIEGKTRAGANEGVASRIGRLTRDGCIPRELAPLMRTITEMRNETEYGEKVLTSAESAAVAAAWYVIVEWAERIGLDVEASVVGRTPRRSRW